jgi:hypothetical protein
MDFKPLHAHNSIAALAAYQQTVQIILRRTTPPSPVSPANIIDCIEMKRATNRHMLQYNPFANPLTKDKGVLVNVWVFGFAGLENPAYRWVYLANGGQRNETKNEDG